MLKGFNRFYTKQTAGGILLGIRTVNRHPLTVIRQLKPKTQHMVTLLLFLAALVCFALFFKAIDFFDKI